MSEYRDILFSLGRRLLFAAPFAAFGLFAFSHAGGSPLQGIAAGLFGCAGVLMAAIILARPLARLFAESSGLLFWPDQHFDRAQPLYSIPQSKRAQGLYEEAMAGFEKIAEEYPGELQPYVELIDVAIVHLRDPGRANEIYQRGLARLTTDDDKEALARTYRALLSRLSAREREAGT
jgi:tetratricopeptide (TPR) repeat protein